MFHPGDSLYEAIEYRSSGNGSDTLCLDENNILEVPYSSDFESCSGLRGFDQPDYIQQIKGAGEYMGYSLTDPYIIDVDSESSL